MTQDDLAKKSGLSKMGIWNYENNKRSPDVEILEKIAIALNCTVADLL